MEGSKHENRKTGTTPNCPPGYRAQAVELERIKEAAELRGQWTATFARDSILAACDKVEKASARRARGDT